MAMGMGMDASSALCPPHHLPSSLRSARDSLSTACFTPTQHNTHNRSQEASNALLFVADDNQLMNRRALNDR